MHHATDLRRFKRKCSKADSFPQLVEIAIGELRKYPNGVEVVCGPISTGGRGSIEENLKAFRAVIKKLQCDGRSIFSQMAYEERIFFFRKRWQDSEPSNAGHYYMPILEEFYLPLFETGLIKKAWFIPGWESSFGARWEREQFEKLQVPIVDVVDEWITGILANDKA